MEINLPLILVALGGLIVAAVAFKLFRRQKNVPRERQPMLGDIDNIINHDTGEKLPRVDEAPVNSSKNSVNVTVEDTALSALGFGNMDSLLNTSPDNAAASNVDHCVTPAVRNSQNIISLYIMAAPGRQFIGYELLQALLAAGLRHGAMSIFHRYSELGGDGQVLFSLASATEPGIFDLSNMGGFSCVGLCMFMDINKVSNPSAALELMFETANQLADDLGGILLDEKRKPLTADTIASYKKCVANIQSATVSLAS